MKTLAILALAGTAAFANAQLAEWDVFGQPGNQTTQAGTGSANVSALEMTRGTGLAASGASNSFSSSGWSGTDADDYISFGFAVDAGYVADLGELYIGTRSSNTGPGTIGLYYSGDGFSSALATITQGGGTFENSVIDLSGLTGLSGNVEFRLIEIGDTQADGDGDTSGGGTFRITGFFANGAFDRNTQFTGTTRLVPAPSSVALLGLGGLVATRRRR